MKYQSPEYHKARRQQRTADGLCQKCSTPVVPNTIYCEYHTSKNRENTKLIGQKRKALGYCATCGAQLINRKCRECANKHKERNSSNKRIIFNHYGYVCNCCGETTPLFLTIDHINGGGRAHKETIPSKNLYKWLIINNFPANFQVLCWNCNSGKYLNNGTCPHMEEVKSDDAN